MRARRQVAAFERMSAWGSHNIAKRLTRVCGASLLNPPKLVMASSAMRATKDTLYAARR